jgi:amylosucrase
MDYRAVRSDLGTMADLSELARTLRASGIALTLDLVLNHVAAEHEWAGRARAGEQRYRRYFHVFPDRQAPDAYEATLPRCSRTSHPAASAGTTSSAAGCGRPSTAGSGT